MQTLPNIFVFMENDLPKIIWFLWLQGFSEAPLVVRKCYDSWQKHNPDWKIIFLDESSIAQHIDLPSGEYTRQAYSDILRINLLAKYGGVWVDATCFSMKPLNEWLSDFTATGFFAFSRPGPDRMISSWFMVANKYNYLAFTYKNIVNTYWTENPGMRFFETSRWYFLNKYLKRLCPQVWFGNFITKILKVYPYFWFHYLFEYIYLRDKQFKKLWDNTPVCSADIPHRLQLYGLFKPLNEELKAEIDAKTSLFYKLTWKYDESEYRAGTVLDYLLKQ